MTFTNTSRATLHARWVRRDGQLVCAWQPLPAAPAAALTRLPRPVRLTGGHLPTGQAVLRALTDRIAV